MLYCMFLNIFFLSIVSSLRFFFSFANSVSLSLDIFSLELTHIHTLWQHVRISLWTMSYYLSFIIKLYTGKNTLGLFSPCLFLSLSVSVGFSLFTPLSVFKVSFSLFSSIFWVEQFVCLGVGGVFHCLDFFLHFVWWIEASAPQSPIQSFGVTIPVVSSNADNISRLQGNVLSGAWPMCIDGDLVVSILPPEIVDVIKRVEVWWSIWVQRLHDLIGHTAHLVHTVRQESYCEFSKNSLNENIKPKNLAAKSYSSVKNGLWINSNIAISSDITW